MAGDRFPSADHTIILEPLNKFAITGFHIIRNFIIQCVSLIWVGKRTAYIISMISKQFKSVSSDQILDFARAPFRASEITTNSIESQSDLWTLANIVERLSILSESGGLRSYIV